MEDYKEGGNFLKQYIKRNIIYDSTYIDEVRCLKSSFTFWYFVIMELYKRMSTGKERIRDL